MAHAWRQLLSLVGRDMLFDIIRTYLAQLHAGFQSVGELTLSGISQLVKSSHSIISFANFSKRICPT